MQQEIGLGRVEVIEEIRIRWPWSETRQRFVNVVPNRIYRTVEGEGELEIVSLPRLVLADEVNREHPHRHGASAP
jgi:hypothetical protein